MTRYGLTLSFSKIRLHRALALSLMATVAAGSAAAYASNGVVLETISDYSFISGGSTANDTIANTEGAGFWNAMTASGTLWTPLVHYTDRLVWDTDFCDPDLTHTSVDNDSQTFDPPGTGISFFIGHGICDDLTNIACTSDANCGANSYCPNFPLSPGQTAACINISPRALLTSSRSSRRQNLVYYGYNPTVGADKQPVTMAFGESASSGAWGGVGTNGGSNIVIITSSCGMRFRVRTQDQNRFFAGVHMVMMNMPVGNITGSSGSSAADTAQWSARGSTLANLILTNVNAPASSAWLSPSFTNNSYSGAGANIVSARDATGTAVTNRMSSETWAQSTEDNRDATSAVVGTYWYTCNFSNCSSFSL